MSEEDNRLINVRCNTCGKVTGNLLGKYDRMLYEGQEILRDIKSLRESSSIDEVLNIIVDKGYVPLEVMNANRDRYLNRPTPDYDTLMNITTDYFRPTGVLDRLGLVRYCCRMTVVSPTILPNRSNIRVGDSIQSREQQEDYKLSTSMREMTLASTGRTPSYSTGQKIIGLPSSSISRLRPTTATPPSRLRSLGSKTRPR